MLAIRAPKAFDGQRVWPDGAVVFVDGQRIVGVEPGTVAIGVDVQILDVPEGTVLPGLVNAHVHLCGDSADGALERLPDMPDEALHAVIDKSLADQLAAGVTVVRDLGDARWAVVDHRDQRSESGRQPHVVVSGPPITSIGGHCWMMGGEVAGLAALRQAVRARVERRVDVVKVMASGGAMTPGTDLHACQFSREELRGVVEEAHDHGLPVTAHAHPLVAIEQAIEAGVDGIEHCTGLTATSVDLPAELLARLRDRHIAVCPTLGFAPDAVPSPVVRELEARTGWSRQRSRQLAAGAHAAGVRIISGDDSGISDGKRHGIFAESVIALHEGGVAVSAALASATSVAAEAIGLGTRKGRLRPGYDADILVVHGDATTEITALRDVALVMIGGTTVIDQTRAADG